MGPLECLNVRLMRQRQSDVVESIEEPVPGEGVTTKQRQWLQVEKQRRADASPWLDRDGWEREMATWQAPLHFIDFETTRVALPFFRGHRPYQTIGFQFSHHTVDEDGDVAHASQFLLADRSTNPNIDFVRALHAAIGHDDGTVFMYSTHENTTLREILYEIEGEPETDIDELTAFLRSIVKPGKDCPDPWEPSRPMVDQLEMVKRFLYLPATHGSNSLKAVLPAILDASDYLKHRYSQPIYGIGQEIPSLNYRRKAWIHRDGNGKLINPYLTLPDLGEGLGEEERAELRGLDTIREGGAALTAYARLMFDDLSENQRRTIEDGLRRYCELDTLAMVFLHEGVQDLLRRSGE